MLIHTVTLPDGTSVERKSASRTYSHVVAIRMNDSNFWRIRNWCGRHELAVREATTVETNKADQVRLNIRRLVVERLEHLRENVANVGEQREVDSAALTHARTMLRNAHERTAGRQDVKILPVVTRDTKAVKSPEAK